MPPRATTVSAEDVCAVVRVHADRVHDAVRRLGCSPHDASGVVERSALDLVAAVAGDAAVGDPVGWWFARARALGCPVDRADVLPLGGGVLSADGAQARLSEVLGQRPEQERLALLLRDSYALPASSVAAALDTGPDEASELVGRARVDFLPLLSDLVVPSLAGHEVDRAGLARLAGGGPLSARDAVTRRHAGDCDTCAGVLDAQERARRLLAGLTVDALPEGERAGLLERVERRARRELPTAPTPGAQQRRGPLSPLAVVVALVLAVLLGVALGALLSRGPASAATARATAAEAAAGYSGGTTDAGRRCCSISATRNDSSRA